MLPATAAAANIDNTTAMPNQSGKVINHHDQSTVPDNLRISNTTKIPIITGYECVTFTTTSLLKFLAIFRFLLFTVDIF